jgi:cyclopropane-fatty-acyl-phospholipid synthase
VFKTRGAQSRVFLLGHVGLLDAYFDQTVDVEGDLAAAFRVALESRYADTPKPLAALQNRWMEIKQSNRTISQARINARYHYGLAADFYRLWLDRELMMYTCAYWKDGTKSIEEAQRNKVEHVAQKIRLKAGETFVDIGCGFGGFLFHAWEQKGALGTGINITPEQVEWLRDEVRRRSLHERIEVREADFREVHRQFDKVVSIGVLEHAGRDQIADVVRAHAQFLKPGGLGVLHFIGHVGEYQTEPFIRKHVFPGGWIPSLAEVIIEMERCGLEVVDIENLRRHYALTLDAWAQRFDGNWDRIRALDPGKFNERFRRIWRSYLYGCAEMFRSPAGYTHLFQIVFSKGNLTRETYPMSRGFLYAAPRTPARVSEAAA